MKVGFTGTREGLTNLQAVALWKLLAGLAPSEAHHGSAVGADAQFDELVRTRHPACRRVAHPGDIPRLTAPTPSDEVREPRPCLERNRTIVEETEMLVACPFGMQEERRSGTWMTVRHARRLGRRIVIVWPDGSVTEEGGGS